MNKSRTGTNGWHVDADTGLGKNVTSTKLQDNEHDANHRHLGANAELEETNFIETTVSLSHIQSYLT